MYVDNNTLSEALLDSHEQGTLTREAYQLFHSLIRHRMHRLVKFNHEQIGAEIETLSMEKIELVWQNYKFSENRPYAYFVSVVDNVIKRYYIDNPIIRSLNINLDQFN